MEMSSERWWTRLARRRFSLPQLGRRGGIEAIVAAILAAFLVLYAGLQHLDSRGLLIELAVCVAAGMSGRWPLVGSVGVGLMLTALLTFPMDEPRLSQLAMFIPIISLGVHGRGGLRTTFTVWYLIVAGLLEAGPDANLGEFGSALGGWVFFSMLAWIAGSSVRVIVLDREAAEGAKVDALKAERRSIARDLHDTVAYSTTTMIMRAEQAKLRGVHDPELSDDLDYIISAGRNSIRDLRSMLEVLRKADPDASPRSPWRLAPPKEVISDRASHLASLGFQVSTLVEADLAKLPDSTKEALSKVVVEATANMAKHGVAGGPCRIMIEQGDDEVTAVFVNSVSDDPGVVQQNHLGLVGLRERVEALGGNLVVRNRQPTWVLEVSLPIGG